MEHRLFAMIMLLGMHGGMAAGAPLAVREEPAMFKISVVWPGVRETLRLSNYPSEIAFPYWQQDLVGLYILEFAGAKEGQWCATRTAPLLREAVDMSLLSALVADVNAEIEEPDQAWGDAGSFREATVGNVGLLPRVSVVVTSGLEPNVRSKWVWQGFFQEEATLGTVGDLLTMEFPELENIKSLWPSGDAPLQFSLFAGAEAPLGACREAMESVIQQAPIVKRILGNRVWEMEVLGSVAP